MARTHQLSSKRILIDKTNSTIVVVMAVAAFVVVFSLVASKTLIGQAAYQNRVISAKKDALNQLKTDAQTSSNLAASYKAFVDTPQNVLGGNPGGNGDKDGDNAKIILDALPSKYDFPALATSLQKIIDAQNLKIQSITGTDEEATQGTDQASATPTAIAMPFELSVTGPYPAMQKLINSFQSSIRPFQIQKMELSGSQNDMTLNLTAQTFYQPGVQFQVTQKAVQ